MTTTSTDRIVLASNEGRRGVVPGDWVVANVTAAIDFPPAGGITTGAVKGRGRVPVRAIATRAEGGRRRAALELPRARMALLNSFEFLWDGERVPLPLPAQRLLAFLALQDRPVLRAYVAGTLWFDSTEGHALGSLRSALWRLRQHGYGLVEATSRQLRLAPGVAVDFHEAVALARGLLAASAELEDVDLDQPGLSGDLLPDWYDDWVSVERERFHELRVRTLESLCARLTEVGKFGKAMEAGLAAIKGEPLRESAHRSLIKVYLAEGNEAEALRRYRLYRRLVHDRFGIEPSEQMEDLVDALKGL